MKIAIDIDDGSAGDDESTAQSTRWLPSPDQCQKWAEQALALIPQSPTDKPLELSLRFVNAAEITRLNGEFRDKPSATNVLSFPSHLPENIADKLEYYPLGDITICPAVIESEAMEQGKTLEAHWAHMLSHGLLHLLGHDHQDEEQASAMESLEIEILEKLGFPNPYLVG